MAKKKTKRSGKYEKKKARQKASVAKKTTRSKKLTRKELVAKLESIRSDLDALLSTSPAHLASLPASNWIVFFDIGETILTQQSNGSFDWIPEAKAAVVTIRSKGVRLGLISNTGTETRASLTNIFPANFFDHFDSQLIVLSSEVQVDKPELGIFYHALKAAQQPASNCIFVVEKQSEAFAAQLAGMRSVLVSDHFVDFNFLDSLVAN